MQQRAGGLPGGAIGVSTLLIAAMLLAGRACAQSNDNPFGLQQRASAASEMIILGVQQAISSLPPTSGQAFTYEYNPEVDTLVRSEQLGPTVLRSTQTVGANRASVRFATSYFDLNKTLGPVDYLATGPGLPDRTYTQFGLSARARVGLLNFGATYGLTDRVEAMVSIPVSVVDAQASQSFLAVPRTFPPASTAIVAALHVPPEQDVDAYIDRAVKRGAVDRANASLTSLGGDFNSGTHAGLGRVGVGVRGLLGANEWGELAASAEFFCNSPSQAEFAGSNSASILPRLIGQVHAAKHLNLYADIGEEHDFQVDELSRFVWDVGASIPIPNATFDFGMGGSKFDQPITWTPVTATGTRVDENGQALPVTITAVNPDSTQLGTNYVDFLFGMKVRLFDDGVLSGAVSVPVNSAGFRAAAVGTIALEYYFSVP